MDRMARLLLDREVTTRDPCELHRPGRKGRGHSRPAPRVTPRSAKASTGPDAGPVARPDRILARDPPFLGTVSVRELVERIVAAGARPIPRT